MRYARWNQHATKMNIRFSRRRNEGFTLIELVVCIAVLAVVIGLGSLAVARQNAKSARIQCVNNLKDIGLGFRIFSTDHQDRFPVQFFTNKDGSVDFGKAGAAFRHFLAMSNELSSPKLLLCPADRDRKPATSLSSLDNANLSYFVALEADETRPQEFLTGDRNLSTNGQPVKPGLLELTGNIEVAFTAEMHKFQGNIAMGDGSVQQFSGQRLAHALSGSGNGTTNRVVVP